MAEETRKLIFELQINNTKLNAEIGVTAGKLKDARDLQKQWLAELDKTKRGSTEYENAAKKVGSLNATIKNLTAESKQANRALQLESSVPGSYEALKINIAQTREAMDSLVIGSEEQIKTQAELNELLQKEIDYRQKQPSLFQARIGAALDESEVLQKQAESMEKLSKGFEGATDAGASFTKILGGNTEKLEGLNSSAKDILKIFKGYKDAVDAVAVAKKVDVESTQKMTFAQKAYTAVVGSSTGGMKLFRLALAGTGIGLIVIALGLLIANFEKVSKWVNGLIDNFKPLRIIVDAITNAFTFLGEKLGVIATKEEKRAQAIVDGVDDVISATEKRYDREIKVAEAAGKKTEDLERAKLEATRASAKEAIDILREKQAFGAGLDKEESDKLKELEDKRNDIITDGLVLEASLKKEFNDKEAAERRKELDKEKEEAKQRVEAQVEAGRMIRDIRIALIKEDDQRTIAKLQEDAKREKDAVNKSLATAEQKSTLVLLIEQKLTQDLQNLYANRFQKLSEAELKRTQEILNDEFMLREIALKEQFAAGLLKEKEVNDAIVLLKKEQLNQELLDLQNYALSVEGIDQALAAKKIEIANFTADAAIAAKNREANETKAADQKIIESAKQKASITQGFIESVGDAFAQSLKDGQLDQEKFNKAIVISALEALQKIVLLAVAEGTAKSIASLGPIAGTIRGAIMAGLINAAFGIAKSQVASFYQGGYTGDGNPTSESTALGKKSYIYHKREYVVPDKVLSTPQGAYHVKHLESMRTGSRSLFSGVSGYADGGFADRSTSSVSDAAIDTANLVLDAIKSVKIVTIVESITEAQGQQAEIIERATA